ARRREVSIALGQASWTRTKQLHPLTAYRMIALMIAIVIAASNLHRDSTIITDARLLLLVAVHVGLTLAIAPRLDRRSNLFNLAVIAVDIVACAGFMTLAHGWRGPLWLYSLSAVFWPAWRYSMRGALISVTVFDVLVLVMNGDRISNAVSDGFGGDVAARLLMVYLIAGAISLTSQAFATVQRMAAESERNRIARDLHDGVGKTMGGISMEALTLAHWIDRDPAEASRRARYVARISEKAAIEVRDVIRGLRRTEATEPLFPSVREIVDDWAQVNLTVRTSLQLNGNDAHVPVLIQGEIVRMLSELLRNVERHARASHVWVRVTLSSAGVTLAVRDDGVGFDMQALDPWSGDGHFGLLGAHERASMLAGRSRVASTLTVGTEVTIDLPLTAREDRAVHVVR
ncbi:MAG TPA: sensor histidine kinase, partial [Thermomicrobiales bacterium]|nr:sensor histidine kinase [Thermomicrobiales bacterium]